MQIRNCKKIDVPRFRVQTYLGPFRAWVSLVGKPQPYKKKVLEFPPPSPSIQASIPLTFDIYRTTNQTSQHHCRPIIKLDYGPRMKSKTGHLV